MDRSAPAPATSLTSRAFAIIFVTSFGIQIGTNGLSSVLPAIGRSIGISDPVIVAVYSLSSICIVLTSARWARLSDRLGRKPLILLGVAGYLVSNLLCGAVVYAGLHRWAGPLVIFGFFAAARAVFGLVGFAAIPASQAYVADVTPPGRRTRTIARLAGASGLGTIIGPALAPLLILPVLGLASPLFGYALVGGALLLLVWRGLPQPARDPGPRAYEAGGARARSIWRDPRAAPYLIYGFAMTACQIAQSQGVGFLIMDRLHLSPAAAQHAIALALMAGALAGMAAQWGPVQWLDLSPRQLMGWGSALAAAGSAIIALAPGYGGAVVGFAVANFGFGFGRPGFTAGASLAVDAHDQGRVAGAMGTTVGFSSIFSPLFMLLYQARHATPFLVQTALIVGAYFYAHVRASTAVPDAPLSPSVLAGLEQADEG